MVDLHEEFGEAGRPVGLGRDARDGREVAQQVRATDPVFRVFEFPVERETVMHDHAPVTDQHARLADRFSASRRRRMDQCVQAAGHDMHPTVRGADPVGRLIRVQHGQGPQERDQRRDEPAQAAGRVRVDVVDGAGGEVHAEQIVHRFSAPFDGYVLTGEQVTHDRADPRPVGHRRTYRGWERRGRCRRATRACARLCLVFGHDRADLRQIDHLAAHHARHRRAVQAGAAASTHRGRMLDDLVRRGGHLQRRATSAGLLAGLAALPASSLRLLLSPFFGLASTFPGRVTRRRQRRVPRIPLCCGSRRRDRRPQLDDLCLQLLDQHAKRSVLRTQRRVLRLDRSDTLQRVAQHTIRLHTNVLRPRARKVADPRADRANPHVNSYDPPTLL